MTLEKFIIVLSRAASYSIPGILKDWDNIDDDLREEYVYDVNKFLRKIKFYLGPEGNLSFAQREQIEQAVEKLKLLQDEIKELMGIDFCYEQDKDNQS